MLTEWFDGTFPEGYGQAIMWTAVALLALIALFVLLRIVRGVRSGTFVAGGRNRKPRLAVMDATPIDARRRLVLVRRDEVEHLILIGGPTDVVVEQDIRLAGSAARPHPAPSDHQAAIAPQPSLPPIPRPPVAQPYVAPRTEAPRPQRPPTQVRDQVPIQAHSPAPSRPAPLQAPAPAPNQSASPRGYTQPPGARPAGAQNGSLPPRPAADLPIARPAYVPPVARPPQEIAIPPRATSALTLPAVVSPRPAEPGRSTPASGATVAPVRRPAPPAQPAVRQTPAATNDLDAALLRELESGLGETSNGKAPAPAKDLSLDDEMSKLLGELSRDNR